MPPKNEKDLYIKIGEALKSIRKEKNLTITDIHAMSEFHSSTISLIERGKQNVSIGWLIHYANILEIDPTEIFCVPLKTIFKKCSFKRCMNASEPIPRNRITMKIPDTRLMRSVF